ncbi:MAG TPA: carotenoid 1,2-hydratase [Casimicrobiaceae bacterium]|nr:carotenoid 1,2-hydratase [Casimicrobiaceae bacterium]
MIAPLLFLALPARSDVRYADVQRGTTLTFPADEGAHPRFRTEWWYVTGWLEDETARPLGFQVTFFRSRPGVAEASESRFAPKQLLFAHAALADPEVSHLIVDQRAGREGFGLASAARDRTDVRIGDWSLVQNGARYAARIVARDFTLDLAFVASVPILLQGDDGVSRKGPDPLDASYYYSRPHLQVDGTVLSGARTRRVTGSAWLDHEWSSRYLTRSGVGWDWIGINLDDGGSLMAFRIRDARGETQWAGGTHRDAHGARRTFAPAEIAFLPQRRWRSPRTGIEYPVSFEVRAGDVSLLLEPLFPDQELDARAGVGAVYWEGAVRATGAGGLAGRGYLELTGYAGALRI